MFCSETAPLQDLCVQEYSSVFQKKAMTIAMITEEKANRQHRRNCGSSTCVDQTALGRSDETFIIRLCQLCLSSCRTHRKVRGEPSRSQLQASPCSLRQASTLHDLMAQLHPASGGGEGV